MRITILRVTTILIVISFLSGGCSILTTPAPAPVNTPPSVEPAVDSPEPTTTTPPLPTPTFDVPADAQILQIAMAPTFNSLDPRVETSPEARGLQSLLYQTLVNLDQFGSPISGLATGWEKAEDGLSYTFFIPDDASFTDGASITATVIAQNLEAFVFHSGVQAAEYPYNIIETIEAVDDNTLAIRLRQPSAALLYALANPRISIISPEWLSRVSADASLTPSGSGPYQLVEFAPGDHITFIKRPEYQGIPVFFDVVRVILTNSGDEIQSLVANGQAQLAFIPQAAPASAEIQPDTGFQTITLPLPRLQAMVFNLNSPIFKSTEVRQALNQAVDRQTLIQTVFNGDAQAPIGVYPPGMPGACNGPADYQFNSDIAREMLNEAGAGDGFSLRALAPEGLYPQDRALISALVENLNRLGIKLNIDFTTRKDYNNSVVETQPQSNYDLYFIEFQFPLFYPTSLNPWVITSGTLNGGKYSNPQVDDLLALSATELDEEQLAFQYCQASQLIWNDAPYLFLIQPAYRVIVSPNIAGFNYSANGLTHLDLLRQAAQEQ
jgi:peptide/nickel transport system substrate-binding protein